MKARLRNMKKYTPRRRRSNKLLQRQQLKDFEHILDMDLNSFLILFEEGTQKQIEESRVKMRSDLRKYGSDLEAIGRDLGEGFPELISNYLKTMNQIAKDTIGPIDSAIINEQRKQALELKKKAA